MRQPDKHGRENRTRVKAFATIRAISHSTLEGEPKPRYITVDITNVGVLPISIPLSFFYWRLPLSRTTAVVMPWDYIQHDQWIPQKIYPFEVKPRTASTFFLNAMSSFHN